MLKKLAFAIMTLLMLCGKYSLAGEKIQVPVDPSAYQLTCSNEGDVCLVKFGIDRYEVLNAEGQSLWIKSFAVNNVVLSPDGEQVAYVAPNDGLFIYTFGANQENKILNLQGVQNTVVGLTWLSSGNKLAYWLFPKNALTEVPGTLHFINAK